MQNMIQSYLLAVLMRKQRKSHKHQQASSLTTLTSLRHFPATTYLRQDLSTTSVNLKMKSTTLSKRLINL